MRISKQLLFLIFLGISLTGFVDAQVANTDSTGAYGRIGKGVYTNSVFGFEVRFPSEWIVLENEEYQELIKAGIRVAEIDEKELEKNKKYRLNLLSLLKKPIGETGNATLVLSAMKQPAMSVSPLAIANITRKGLSESPTIKFESDTRLTEINGRQFATFDYSVLLGTRATKGKYLVTIVRDYSITLIVSNEHSEDDNVVSRIVSSLQFK